MPCGRKVLSRKINAEHRALRQSNSILSALGSPENHEAISMLFKLSMHSIPPTFAKFSFIGTHISVDMYAILDFASMHVLLLGIFWPFKECF